MLWCGYHQSHTQVGRGCACGAAAGGGVADENGDFGQMVACCKPCGAAVCRCVLHAASGPFPDIAFDISNVFGGVTKAARRFQLRISFALAAVGGGPGHAGVGEQFCGGGKWCFRKGIPLFDAGQLNGEA